MDLNTILLIIAVVLALPGGLFVAYLLSLPRARFLALVGGVIGDVAIAAGLFAFIQFTSPNLDALSFFVGAFFASSLVGAIGAPLADFIVGLGRCGTDV